MSKINRVRSLFLQKTVAIPVVVGIGMLIYVLSTHKPKNSCEGGPTSWSLEFGVCLVCFVLAVAAAKYEMSTKRRKNVINALKILVPLLFIALCAMIYTAIPDICSMKVIVT